MDGHLRRRRRHDLVQVLARIQVAVVVVGHQGSVAQRSTVVGDGRRGAVLDLQLDIIYINVLVQVILVGRRSGRKGLLLGGRRVNDDGVVKQILAILGRNGRRIVLAVLLKEVVLLVVIIDGRVGRTRHDRGLLNVGRRGGRRVHIDGNLDGHLLGAGVGGLLLGRNREARARKDALLQLRQSNALVRVDGEDAGQDVVQLVRQRQNGLEEARVAGIGAVRRVLDGGLLPRVTAAGQVDQDDAEAPDIVGRAVVVGALGVLSQAFCTTVSI